MQFKLGKCDKFYFTFNFADQNYQKFEKDPIPIQHLLNLSKPNTNKTIDIWIILNIKEYYIIVFIISQSASYFTAFICKYIV